MESESSEDLELPSTQRRREEAPVYFGNTLTLQMSLEG